MLDDDKIQNIGFPMLKPLLKKITTEGGDVNDALLALIRATKFAIINSFPTSGPRKLDEEKLNNALGEIHKQSVAVAQKFELSNYEYVLTILAIVDNVLIYVGEEDGVSDLFESSFPEGPG